MKNSNWNNVVCHICLLDNITDDENADWNQFNFVEISKQKVCIFQRMPYITDILHLNNDKISVSKGKTLIMDRMTNEKKSRAVGILIFYYLSYVIKQALVFLKTQKG